MAIGSFAQSVLPALAPSSAWTGVPGSGFDTAPQDPPRSTAKSVMRLMVPPNQSYTKELVVGIYAGANNGGTLFDRRGLKKIVAHYENSNINIDWPTIHTITDANGQHREYFGWWLKLKHEGRHGDAQLYLEAVPQDASMQPRVLGPYQFSPSAATHDHSIRVAPSLEQVTGETYTSLGGALAYLKSVSAQRPLVTVVESGDYDMPNSSPVYEGAGYCTIVAEASITIGKTALTSDAQALIRPKYSGLRFRGANVTIDTRYISEIYSESSTQRQHWLDGCTLTNSGTRGDQDEHRWRCFEAVWIDCQEWLRASWRSTCTFAHGGSTG